MTTAELLAGARRAGVTLTLNAAGQVRSVGPATALTPAFVKELRKHRDKLARILAHDARILAHDVIANELVSRLGAEVVYELVAPYGYVLAPCDVCGERMLVRTGKTRLCGLTPHCPGRHGDVPGTEHPAPREKAPKRGASYMARAGDVVSLVRCRNPLHNGRYRKHPDPCCEVLRTVELGWYGALPGPDSDESEQHHAT